MGPGDMTSRPRIAAFREHLRAGRPLVGTFLKTPSAAMSEILGKSGLDCVCIDAEHAPFDRSALDAVLLAARAEDLPSLVRVALGDSAHILNALDLGATGVVVPHITSAAAASEAARVSRYGPDGRGFAGSTRAAGYTTRTMAEIIADANAASCVIAQIEDASAVEQIDEIAAVPGIDCLFIGQMDLTVSLGVSSPNDPTLIAAVERICEAGKRHGRSVGMFTPTVEEAGRWRDCGASFFLIGSDQAWVLHAARELATTFQR
jgi:2-keto-3-deoxy-L-rhamnonate aldolase RhmA